ncbi:PREDICTED: blood group Rh(CE) polypeptide isoform X3 [Miniopterus natalensis]|uniref:blood group Rh(CE) polypeptide isoform X3 n=1 Tax=Miniopterus natalensis TaxID=291302 RepID=UPI0007A6EA1A|nr:PREDICTED: blood group Rh(CE) polypeptide isoform X3 [Miniopterus natalensis]
MSSKYPRSVRGCLPLWTLTLEGALIVAFFFFTEYDISPNNHKTMVILGAVLQDLTVMAALGLGFLPSALWRFGWSSVAFALLMLALGVQWAVLLDGFPKLLSSEKVVITLPSIQKATMSAMSVLISAGAILGKTNLVQLVVMVLMEVAAFVAMRVISHLFLFDDHVSMMHVHVFAAYFGLMVARCLSRRMPKAAEEKNRRTTSPSLFAMLGTLFLWMFWPSFNSALIFMPLERKTAVFNTYYALAVSTVTAISVSALVHPQGKINMNHVHNAVLAGGVAVGASCHIIASPWIAMVLGLLAGLIVGGAKCLQVCFNHVLGIDDTCGVHYTFGLPGLLGGIAYIGLMTYQAIWSKDPMVTHVALLTTGALSLAVAMGLASGLLTGLLLQLKIWRAPHAAKYFDDQAFWEFPHLAVGF